MGTFRDMQEKANQKAHAPTSSPSVSTPAYIPWKTFTNYIESLKSTTLPHTLDNTVKPKEMAGGLWRQLLSALQFLDLIDADKIVQDRFGELRKAYATEQWAQKVKECVLPAYSKIVKDLPIERASGGQLEKCFKDNAGVDGQMGDKAIRFYLYALREGGVKYSDHLGIRKSKGTKRAATTRTKPAQSNVKPKEATVQVGTNGADKSDPPPKGTRDFPLFFKGGRDGLIRVPNDLNADDCKMIELSIPLIQAYAAQQAAG
jgi:hypothetical protein